MKKIVFALTIILLASCQLSEKFEVLGHVEGAASEMIYLEHSGLSKITVLDSIKINKKGDFKFKHRRPEHPDFYRIKLANRYILFAVDSTETIEIQASKEGFSKNYSIQPSINNSDIQWLRNSASAIQLKIKDLNLMEDGQAKDAFLADIIDLIEQHKDTARHIILTNPRSTAAYFAIYQKINDIEFFSPYIKEDRPYCAAVATAYHTFMPNYSRSKSLYNYVIEAIQTERQAQQQADWKQIMEEVAVGYIDIALPDKDGKEQKLSSLAGKMILLDFSNFEMKESIAYTFVLRELHQKYASKGFEIYQISLDNNKLLWQNAVENLPWISVRDENGANTSYARLYNITALPTHFLIDKSGNIIARDMDFKKLEKEIQKRL